MKQSVVIGVQGVIRNQDDEILMMLRCGSVGDGQWGLPGGQLEHGETLEECLIREMREELHIEVKRCIFIGYGENIHTVQPDSHHVQMGFLVDAFEGKPVVAEPAKCVKLDWFPVNHLPVPLFEPARVILDQYHAYRK